MKLMYLLMFLLNQDAVLVEQKNVSVPLSDLDSYVHNLPPESRFGFAEDAAQIERNILSILNINFVYKYIHDNKLDNKPEFSSAIQAVESATYELDQNFIDELKLDEKEFLKNMKMFTLKKELFMRMKVYIQNELLAGPINTLAFDQFLIEKKDLKIEEKRSLSVITLLKSKHSQDAAVSILTDIVNGKDFNEMASAVSDDESVKLNRGNLSFYTQKQFKYKFSADVFAVEELGVIPVVFESKNNYMLISVDEIVVEKEAVFEDHKQRIIDELLPTIAQSKLQNIINYYSANHQININREIVDEAFKRYLVFETTN